MYSVPRLNGGVYNCKSPLPTSTPRSDGPLAEWMKSFMVCRLAVTITFGTGRSYVALSPSKSNVEEILRKGIKRINSLCYGNMVKRKGLSIGAITVIEGGSEIERIHAHIGFEPPPEMSLQLFRVLVVKAFKPSKWIERRPFIKTCWSQDWVSYMLKLGQDSLVPSCCFKAKHASA